MGGGRVSAATTSTSPGEGQDAGLATTAVVSADPDAGWGSDLVLVLEAMAPGPELVELLSGLEPGDLSEVQVLEVIAAWQRVAGWVAHAQGRVVHEHQVRQVGSVAQEFAVDEVACRLVISRAAADRMVDLAWEAALVPAFGDALGAGVLDTTKAHALISGLFGVPVRARRVLMGDLVGQAQGLTAPQLRARAVRAACAADPAWAAARHRRERAERDVTLTPRSDAMALIQAFLPADDAVTVYTALTAMAGPGTPGDDRPIGTRRADALTAVMAGVLADGHGPSGPLSTRHGRRPHLQVTLAATTLAGLDDQPGDLDGYGPIPAEIARTIATDATWQQLLTDPHTGTLLTLGPRLPHPGTIPRHPTRTGTEHDNDPAAARTPREEDRARDQEPLGDTTSEEASDRAATRPHATPLRLRVGRDDTTGQTTWTDPTGRVFLRRGLQLIPADSAHTDDTTPPAGATGAGATRTPTVPDIGPPPF